MVMKLRILPYKMSSESARLLARELGCLRIYPNRNTYVPRRNHLVVNWGLSVIPSWMERMPSNRVLNHPTAVAMSSNKIYTFRAFAEHGVKHPTWTQDINIAKEWVSNGSTVYCRTTVTGHGGEGIVLANCIDEIVEAKLFTKGVDNETEYRVHVFDGQVIDFIKKARRRGEEVQPSRYIRNHKQGWVFVREGVELPQEVKEEAVRAIKSLSLDFGAVDICYTSSGEACVFEVNTAPGIMGTSLERYKQALLRRLYN